MKSSILTICAVLFLNSTLFAQQKDQVIVKAGTRVIDYFPVNDRYLYAGFTAGEAIFSNNRVYPSVYNFNLLTGEMEFIKSNDTLMITDKTDLLSIVVAQDTFYYGKGYQQIIQNGQFKVYVKRGVVTKDIRKKGAMGTVNRSAASESYDYLLANSLSINLVADIDMVLEKEDAYYFSTNGKDFTQYTKTNVVKVVPGKKDVITNYINATKTDFKSKDDLLKLANIVNKILSENSRSEI